MTAAILALVIGVALFFNYTNGFHDAANAVASAVSTRALTLRAALTLGAVMNLIGALLSTGVAATVAKGIIEPPGGVEGLVIIFSAIVGAVVWNLTTWYFGLPSSSSHALLGGMVGAALAAAVSVEWTGVITKVIIPMVVSPVIGLALGFALMIAVMWIFRSARPRPVIRGFRRAQVFSAAGLALGHGLQDAQKSMGIIVLALVVSGHQDGFAVPLWVTLACAAAMAAGTYSGGLRIMRTLGRRIFGLTPSHGFVAETSGALVLYGTAFVFAAPVSTTHVITSAIMGAGATRRVSAVRWGVAGNIIIGWFLTLPAAAIVAALVYWAMSMFVS
ncbi:MAG: inorganic phosphate transporter [Sciscionella sp.]